MAKKTSETLRVLFDHWFSANKYDLKMAKNSEKSLFKIFPSKRRRLIEGGA